MICSGDIFSPHTQFTFLLNFVLKAVSFNFELNEEKGLRCVVDQIVVGPYSWPNCKLLQAPVTPAGPASL